MIVGILALQGAFREHEEMLTRMGVPCLQVRLPRDLAKVDRLIIPGGESTTIGKLLVMYDLIEPIRQRVLAGMPIWGTCAGAILLSNKIIDGKAEITINDKVFTLGLGEGMIIPAHALHHFNANEQFKMIATVIKSGYED